MLSSDGKLNSGIINNLGRIKNNKNSLMFMKEDHWGFSKAGAPLNGDY